MPSRRSSAGSLDLASPDLLRMMEKNWAPVVREGGAPFRFGPAENTRFFEPMGWREVEYRSTLDEGTPAQPDHAIRLVLAVHWTADAEEAGEAFARFSGMAFWTGPTDRPTD